MPLPSACLAHANHPHPSPSRTPAAGRSLALTRPAGAGRSRVIYPLLQGLVRGALAVGFRLAYRGREHVPGSGPLILAANHQSFLDPFFLGAGIPLRPRYLVYYTYMRMPLIGAGARFFGGLPVGHGPPARSLRSARAALEAGDVVEIFPEGARSPDGRVHPFARGFAHLARVTGAPVLPAAILGAHGAWPPGRKLPRPSRVEVIFGPPVAPPAAVGGPPAERRAADRRFADAVREVILALAAGRLEAAPRRGDAVRGPGRLPTGSA